jgi:hypothetical protein
MKRRAFLRKLLLSSIAIVAAPVFARVHEARAISDEAVGLKIQYIGNFIAQENEDFRDCIKQLRAENSSLADELQGYSDQATALGLAVTDLGARLMKQSG